MSPAWRASVLWAFALGGCAAFDAHSLDRSAGWHAAQVVAVGRAGDLSGTADRDCGAAAGDASARYAVVRYHNGGVHSRSLGTDRLPADTELKVGDAMYVNILDCAAPLMTPAQRGSNSGAPSR